MARRTTSPTGSGGTRTGPRRWRTPATPSYGSTTRTTGPPPWPATPTCSGGRHELRHRVPRPGTRPRVGRAARIDRRHPDRPPPGRRRQRGRGHLPAAGEGRAGHVPVARSHAAGRLPLVPAAAGRLAAGLPLVGGAVPLVRPHLRRAAALSTGAAAHGPEAGPGAAHDRR